MQIPVCVNSEYWMGIDIGIIKIKQKITKFKQISHNYLKKSVALNSNKKQTHSLEQGVLHMKYIPF